MSAAEAEQRQATTADTTRSGAPGRRMGGMKLSTIVLVGGVLVGGYLYYRKSRASALVGAAPTSATAKVPYSGYGSANAPSSNNIDWGSVIAQEAGLAGAVNQGAANSGQVKGVLTNPPQVEYGAKDPNHPIAGLKDELNGVRRWVSAPGGTHIPGGPVGYGAAGGENTPNVFTTSSGQTYSELPGGSAFMSALGSGTEMYWQPQPGTFLTYPIKRVGDHWERAPGAPAYGTPVFVKQ